MFDTVYVNNNGNVTFDHPLSEYTPFGLQGTSRRIIAPYFADVDTRGSGSGLLTYGSVAAAGGNPAMFCANWVNVGYFGRRIDKKDSFQLLLIDRSAESRHRGDFDIVFNYNKIKWETGDASGGHGGLGGSSARVGYSNGTSRSFELPGSGTNGALLDGGTRALTGGSLNSSTPGRYVFPVRNGAAPAGGTVHGVVTDRASPPNVIRDAPLQVCNATGSCHLTKTNGLGHYSVAGLPAGDYTVTVNPPAGSSLLRTAVGPRSLQGNGDLAIDVGLDGAVPIPAGTTITHHRLNPDGTPILEWRTRNTLTTTACRNGHASAVIALTDGSSSRTVHLTESPAGSGHYSGSIPDLYPLLGAATVTITISCGDPTQDQTIRFTVYIDPAGFVVDTDGTPIPDATVTLLRSDNATGPFDVVPSGSPLLSPANRVNPDRTTPDGTFGWDVLTGYYQVQASKPGCTSPSDPTQHSVTSVVLAVPPPVTDLRLTLSCPHAPDVHCTILGTAHDDVLYGTPMDDVICGGGGNDRLVGRGGDDRLLGGAGDDRLEGAAGADVLDGGEGNDDILGLAGDDRLEGGAGDDRLEGAAGADVLDGGEGNDDILGLAGDDRLEGGAGDDRLEGAAGADVLDGGIGDDQLLGGDGDDILLAGSGSDQLEGGAGTDELHAGEGTDALNGGIGSDLCDGGPDRDVGIHCERLVDIP
jgi:Ca2+-binding RTX toxin-like protein